MFIKPLPNIKHKIQQSENGDIKIIRNAYSFKRIRRKYGLELRLPSDFKYQNKYKKECFKI